MFRFTLFKLKRVLRFGFIAMACHAFLLLYSEGEVIWLGFLGAFAIGVGTIFIKEFIVSRRLKQLPVYIEFVVQFLFINLIIIAFILFEAYSNLGIESLDRFDLAYFADLLQSKGYIHSIFKYSALTFFLFLFYNIESILGSKTFLKYIKGTYNIPRQENRIFMFIDMKNSTAIAEKMNDSKKFYSFVNECFYFMTGPTLKHQAYILKYIGDEIIFHWEVNTGFKNDNCVKLHFEIQKIMKEKEGYFLKKYGFAPEFKSGIHGGECIGAFLGHLKKTIDYSGDTVNTAARIQGMCNEHEASLLISQYIYNGLGTARNRFDKTGQLELKGKEERVLVYKWNNF